MNRTYHFQIQSMDIRKRTVLCNGELDFVYHHMNQNMQIKTGKCHSVPTVQENEKIELSEQWQWTSGDYSKGESLLVEV